MREPFRLPQEGFALRGERLSGRPESHQRATRGSAQDGHFVSIFAAPLGPPFTGVIPLAWQWISGAQNLSDTLNSRRATGP